MKVDNLCSNDLEFVQAHYSDSIRPSRPANVTHTPRLHISLYKYALCIQSHICFFDSSAASTAAEDIMYDECNI